VRSDMNDDTPRGFDINVVQIVEACAETCVDDVLHALAAHPATPILLPRRRALIERTTSALLRILADESQGAAGESNNEPG
jgi:hypothetical protein